GGRPAPPPPARPSHPSRLAHGPAGVARRIAQVRRQLGLTQGAFARRIGVSRNAVGRYEAGTVVPSAATLNRIAEAGRVTNDWLLRGHRPGVTTAPGRDPAWKAAVAFLHTLWPHPERRAEAIAVLRALQPE